MKKIFHILYRPCLILLCFFLCNCTENFLFKEDKIENMNVIKGRVELSDSANPKDVYVWFQVFDIGTKTDTYGNYTLTLPSPSEQTGGGLSGIYPLYFYVANYGIDSLIIPILNGYFQRTYEETAVEGNILQPVKLHKILSINASTELETVSMNYQDSILAVFTVKALEDPIWIRCIFSRPRFKGDPQYMSGFIKKINSSEESVQKVQLPDRGHRTATFKIDQNPISLLPLRIDCDSLILSIGEYEIIPFMLVQQDNLPSGLINSLGENAQNFSLDFINIPLKVGHNQLIVH